MWSDSSLKVRSTSEGRADRQAADAAGEPVTGWEMAACFAVAALLDAYLGLRYHPEVLDGLLLNPDSYMRVVRLREILSQHALVNIVSRDAAGAGMELYWSHLIDALVLLLAAPLSLFLGMERAVHWVTLAAGPISVGCLAVAIAWAVAPLTDRRPRWFVSLFLLGSPAVNAYALPGVIHHHIPVAAAVVMTAGWAVRSPDRGTWAGWGMGISAALAIWLTPESMPFVLAAFAGLGLFWLLHPETVRPGEALRSAGIAFLAATAAALLIDPPFGGYLSAVIDRLSIVYLALAAAACAVGCILHRLDRRRLPPLQRGMLGAIAACAAIGIWLAAFPSILAGTYGVQDEAAARIYFGGNLEMQPIATVDDAINLILSAAIATVAAATFAIRRRSLLWAYITLWLGLMLVLAVLHQRFATYPETAAVAMLPVILTAIDRLERRPALLLTAARLAVFAVFLASPLWPTLSSLSHPNSAQAHPAPVVEGCDERALARLLAPYPGEVVLSDLSEAPALLYFSEVRVAGSLYQRNIDAFMRLRAAWRSPDSAMVPAAVRATKATLILACTRRAGRSALVADLQRPALLDQLSAGTPPSWLMPVAIDGESGYALYRVSR